MIKRNDKIIGMGCRNYTGKVIGIEDDVVYILMKDPEAPIFDGDGQCGVEIMLLSDIWDEDETPLQTGHFQGVRKWYNGKYKRREQKK